MSDWNSHYAGQRRRVRDFAKLWERQDGKCAICEMTFENESEAHLDHDHSTGKSRGLLCILCNSGLGMFRDEVLHLRAAIRYLDGTYHESLILKDWRARPCMEGNFKNREKHLQETTE